MANDDTPVWFITGCSTGFGRELAKAVLERGWRVVATARRTEQLDDLLAGHGDRALKLRLDVTDHAEVVSSVKEAEARFGRIDVLVNNAGYGYLAAIEEGEDAAIRAQFETNVFGLADLIREALPGMRKRRSGNIVNYSSIGGLVSFGATGYYHASKYAVEGLSESLAVEVGPLGIHVTLVEPGPFRTDWAGRSIIESKTVIDDYAETAGARRKQTRERSGNQAGDPVRAAEAVITAVTAKEPPLRLLLGAPALELGLRQARQAQGQLRRLEGHDARLRLSRASKESVNPAAAGRKLVGAAGTVPRHPARNTTARCPLSIDETRDDDDGKRHSEVVQRHQGLRLHSARRWWPGRIRPYLRRRARWDEQPQRGAETLLRDGLRQAVGEDVRGQAPSRVRSRLLLRSR